MSDRLYPAPPMNAESAPFYEAAKQGRFLIKRCLACGKPHWYPRSFCPFCMGDTEWTEASGDGVIYSYSIVRRPEPGFAIAYVTLRKGRR